MQPDNDQQTGQWQFIQDDTPAQAASASSSSAESKSQFSWSASEFVAYHKGGGWYVMVFFGLIALVAIVFFITSKDFISAGSVLLIGILFMIYASRKPRVLAYQIDKSGVRIGEKLYPFSVLRSFAVIDEGSLHSISLLPLKRFMPSISMYFEPKDESTIVEVLGKYLPKEDKSQDMVDRFMHKIRF